MGRGTSTLVLLVLALGLGAYLYFVDSTRPVGDPPKTKVFSYDSSKINQVRLKSSGGEVTSLRKGSDDTWTITEPTEAPADRGSVTDVVTNLANLEEDRVVEENATDLKAFGLAEPRIDVTFHVEGEQAPRRLLLGDKTPTNTGVYAKLPTSNRVFLVSSMLDTSLNKTPFDFRDKAALKFEQDKVTSVELTSAASTVRLEKSGDDWKLVKPVQAPADFSSVSSLISQLQNAQMTVLKDRPEDLKDLKQYGLDKPAAVARLGAGSSVVTLEIGGAAETGQVWARDASKPAVFSIASSIADDVKKTAADFRRKDVFEFRPYNTTRFEITRGTETRAFERVKGTGENAVDTWKQVAPSEKTVDSSNFEGALLDFSNLRAESFEDRAASTKDTAVITVKFDEGKKEERVTIGTTASGAFAMRPDQPGAMKIEAGKYEAALKKLDSIQ